MKLAYFVSKEDISLMKYEALCELAFSLDVKDMPLRRDYSSYINIMAAKEFITCISCYLENHQRNDLSQSPYLALMINESTDRVLEKHLIVYASYLNKDGLGVSKCEFLKLILVADGYAQTKYNAIMNMFSEMSLDIKHLVGISTYGDSSMLGCHEGLVSKLSRDVPNLIDVHCVAHREALAIVDACKCFPCLSYVDKIANKVYSWINASNVRHLDFQKLLQEMNLQVLEVLQIHDVRWLARGNMMVRLVKLLPPILTFWKCQAPMWYEKLCIFKVLFCIFKVLFYVADVLLELDGLNKIFQKESIDITSFSTSIEVCLNSLKKKFLGDIFAKNTIYLKLFIENAQMGYLKHVNDNGEEYTHTLLYVSMPSKDKNGFPLDIQDGSLNTCIEMAKGFVLKVIDCVNARFPDMYFFNASKLFSPMYYLSEEDERVRKTIIWLSRFLTRIGNHVINANGCEKELKAFVDTLYYGCEETFPNLLKLWQILLVLPISSVPCERGFSKQNIIKNDRRQHLKVDTLDMLMRISMLGPSCDLVNWERIYDIWEKSKDHHVADL
ncbi:hypothetical protein KP509_36G032200 [Ceratopteris richardii]|uniref:HAT C-terminal dimerisation domain-containing protein n=1 Tax=Ceratopteris richardii TaxID=49495 RepID=A0A8T2QBE6_CERRI|nr:hypothetical protein KP509_36G032200 [Ceratopteris richardii]